jgi:hypothetical protein
VAADRASVADRGVRAVPGEPVAWQERQQVSPTQWSDWYERRSGWSLSRDQEIESSGIRYQFRPLFLAASVASPAAPASPSVAQNDQAVAAPCAEQCWACAESGIGCNLVNDGAVPSVLPAQEVAESFYVRFAKEWITADDKSREDIKGWVEGWYESDNTPAPAASAQPQAPQAEAVAAPKTAGIVVEMPDDEDLEALVKWRGDKADPYFDRLEFGRAVWDKAWMHASVAAKLAAPPSATAQAAPHTTAASAQALGEAGEVKRLDCEAERNRYEVWADGVGKWRQDNIYNYGWRAWIASQQVDVEKVKP